MGRDPSVVGIEVLKKNGIIKNIFRDIDVKNHGKEIVESLKKLAKKNSGNKFSFGKMFHR